MKTPFDKLHWLQEHGLAPKLDQPTGAALMQSMAAQAVAAWNHTFPIGTKVKVYRIYGDEATAYETTTASEAWVMGGHSAMVKVQGAAGGMALTNVEPLVSRSEVGGQTNLQQLKDCVKLVLGGGHSALRKGVGR